MVSSDASQIPVSTGSEFWVRGAMLSCMCDDLIVASEDVHIIKALKHTLESNF